LAIDRPSRLRVAFIGAGNLATRVHYPSVAESTSAEIVAVCDLDGERRQQVADTYSVRARYRDHRAMLREARPDVVYVVMPPMHLSPIVVECCEAGAHVFVEKPPGVDLADCERMSRAAERNGCLTMVGFNRRFAPVLREARRLVLERGPIVQTMAEFHKGMLASGPYYGMNILRTDVIHAIDVLSWLGGEAEEVLAVNQEAFADWESGHAALVRFQGGAVGLLAAHRAGAGRYERFEIHGRGISAYVRAPESAEVWIDGDEQARVLDGRALAGSDDFRIWYGYAAETSHFLARVHSGEQPETSITASLRTMRLVEAIAAGRKERIA
jgi:virulence factor